MALSRKDIPQNLKWNTSDIYASIEDWEKDYSYVENNSDFSEFSGKLGEIKTVKACFDKLTAISAVIEKLYVYASMRHDEDTRDSFYSGLLTRAQSLYVKYSASSSFIEPELTSLSSKKLSEYIASDLLADYSYRFECILKEKPHVLSGETENVLALGGQVFEGYRNVFSMINNADIKFPTVSTREGDVVLSHGMYGVLIKDDDRAVREEVFKKYYSCFKDSLNTITATYAGNVYKDVFIAKARKYESCLDEALRSEDVDGIVYKNLLKSVHDNLILLHRFVSQKKQALGLSEMHMWDIYATTCPDAELKLGYEDAFSVVKKGLAPLGDDYVALLQTAHDNGWIDVEETPGKRSGAYSTGAYLFNHPYVLLNYQQTTGDIFTIAHELGHAMHTNFSNTNQPASKADYTIFVAEVASTVNEVLLLKYLLKTSESKKPKKYLLSYYTDMIKSTLFRQTMFAEFEFIAHRAAETSVPLTSEFLCAEYLKLNKTYYGNDIVSDEEISWEWARIPHFYSAFYVYKYATGIISAITIAERILKEGAPAVSDYKKFLSSGGSASPVDLLKIAGVDLTDEAVYKVSMQSFKHALDDIDDITL